jgi:uncharacterized membrane protein YtjA (UPF0391 family)
MIPWILIFLATTAVAAILGFSGLAGSEAGLAQVFAFIFFALALSSAAAMFNEQDHS